MTLEAGTTIGRYQILGTLGHGGMASVYKAFQPALERVVALKVLRPAYAHDPEFLERFRREALAIARLRHPHIVQVHDFDEAAGLVFLVMEHIEGGTLKQKLTQLQAEGGGLPWGETARIVGEVAEALAHAHAQGIVHRDVKPSNVMLTRDGRAVVTDFGIAKILAAAGQTQTGVGVGTPEYMSPEQGQAAPVDHRSDVYSLGVMAYELLTGRVPFTADTPLAVMLAHVREPLPLPSKVDARIGPRIERVLLRALAKDPAARYQSATELAAALEGAIAAEERGGTIPTVVSAGAGRARSRAAAPRVPLLATIRGALATRSIAAGLIAGIVLLSAVGGGVVVGLFRAERSAPSAPATAAAPSALATTSAGAGAATNAATASQPVNMCTVGGVRCPAVPLQAGARGDPQYLSGAAITTAALERGVTELTGGAEPLSTFGFRVDLTVPAQLMDAVSSGRGRVRHDAVLATYDTAVGVCCVTAPGTAGNWELQLTFRTRGGVVLNVAIPYVVATGPFSVQTIVGPQPASTRAVVTSAPAQVTVPPGTAPPPPGAAPTPAFSVAAPTATLPPPTLPPTPVPTPTPAPTRPSVDPSAPKYSVSGRVTSSVTAAGLGGVPISVFFGGPLCCYGFPADAQTDTAGNYTLSLPNGTYKIRAVPEPATGYAVRYWRAGRSTSTADELVVSGRALTNIDLSVATGFQVTGTVKDAAGRSLAQANVIAHYANGHSSGSRSDPSGQFVFRLETGSYELLLYPPTVECCYEPNLRRAVSVGSADLALGDITIP